MGCACNRAAPVGYQVLFKGGEPTQEVKTLAEVRTLLRNSSKGGNYKPIAAKK